MAQNAGKLFCIKGHSLSGDNITVYTNNGFTRRGCKICAKIRYEAKK